MESRGAIVFLPREEQSFSPFLSDILHDPAALWLSETLRSTGVERFFAVCEGSDLEKTRACFPEGSVILSDGDTDATARLHAFLEENPGGVVVVTRPVLLAPEGTTFSLPGKEPPKCVYDLKGSTLLAALRDGKSFGEAVNALGDTSSWRGRYLPLKEELSYRAFTVDPLAKSLSVERLIAGGVRVMDPANTYVGPAVTVGEGSTILPGTTLYGRTRVGRDCVLGPNTLIRDCALGDAVTVNSSQLTESVVEDEVVIGPFAYIRPHCHLKRKAKIGDFVELKNSVIGEGTKINHLTYVGDTDAGAHINFGCGTVTVNYDGAKKFRTTIGDGAFIGCNTNLVAPVVIGEGAYTAAGSTITEDVPPDSLAIARERQTVKKNWVKRRRGN